ncbi:MAG TPA: transporter [Hypericibacter adhaerens]|jgi:hypothetical protein|uniref:Phenol degradation protein n=1 Tax=Hypericibacter adhaerens TaxID=2602016 RepID=A0A5J6MZR2_9PROT|nr:transporter [Hypericibacter adhaerens]QEX22657.1 hypothetical protein FRZ61_25890 [Hypericibacter adhaerens]HWA45415.1 transporter [Hypericibacter adhaerens]
MPGRHADAGGTGHYFAGLPNARDTVMPAPGYYALLYSIYYSADRYYNDNGQSVDSVKLPDGTKANVNADVNLFVLAPAFIWVADWDVLGGHYGAYIVPTFSNTSIDAEVSTLTGLGRNAKGSTFGMGDLFVQPIWLGWNKKHWDFTVGYGFYAPTGRFDAGSRDNIGLGFWTHQFQGSVAWYPFTNRGTAVIGTGTYEINQNAEGEDLTPGQRASLNLAIDQYLPLDEQFLLDVAVTGYGQWQTTDDTGSDAANNNRDSVYGVGPQIGIVYLPSKISATFRWNHEVWAQDRIAGDVFALTLGVGF